MASHWSVQKCGVLYASEARNIAAVRVHAEDELAKAKALVEKAARAEAKKQREIFLDAVMARRSEIMKTRTAHKKLRVELGKEVKAKVRVLKKASGMYRQSSFFSFRQIYRSVGRHSLECRPG